MLKRIAKEGAQQRLQQLVRLHDEGDRAAAQVAVELHALRVRWSRRVHEEAMAFTGELDGVPKEFSQAMAALVIAQHEFGKLADSAVEFAAADTASGPAGVASARVSRSVWTTVFTVDGELCVPTALSSESAVHVVRDCLRREVAAHGTHGGALLSVACSGAGSAVLWPAFMRRFSHRRVVLEGELEALVGRVEAELDSLRRTKTELQRLVALTRQHGSAAVLGLARLRQGGELTYGAFSADQKRMLQAVVRSIHGLAVVVCRVIC